VIKVLIPSINSSEIKYTIDVLLSTFLGLNYNVDISSKAKNVVISCGDNEITLISSFFQKDIIYTNENLPFKLKNVDVLSQNCKMNLVSLFEGETCVKAGKKYPVEILASTFFMLSRWEEFVNPKRDSHNRFSAKSSIAYKFGFLDRPIVNEYLEFLWSLLESIGCTQERKNRKYKLIPTHDVDRPFLFTSWFQNIRLFGGYFKRLDFQGLIDFCKYALKGIDPWDTHELFMDLSEKANVKSYFFFLPKGKNKHDGRYNVSDPKIKKLYQKIKDRGHYIGFHPSYNAYNDKTLFRKEKSELEKAVGEKMKFGRQHYLRFSIPYTWQIWNQCEMDWDSSLSYADCSGFRCGVCYPFPVFDIEQKKQLKLYERPLIVMEGSLIGYEKLSLEDAKIKVDKLKSQVKKYNGEFVFLYHNSSFFEGNYRILDHQLLNHIYQ
jgi:hypothetical protein